MFYKMSLQNFKNRFETETACIQQLVQLKWPDGFICPRCGHRSSYTIQSRRHPLFECRLCRHQTSAIAGTIMEGSRTPLTKWFLALYLLTNCDTGLSAAKLGRVIHVTYKTAWLILHKIRHAIGHLDASLPLQGDVRAFSEIYGRPYNPTIYRHKQEHPVWISASLTPARNPQYMKIKLISNDHLSGRSILKLGITAFREQHIGQNVQEVSIYPRRFGHDRPPAYHTRWRHIRECIWSTHRGIGRRHLQAYLNEYCYRYNITSAETGDMLCLLKASVCSSSPVKVNSERSSLLAA
ncbi:transposase [Paenibacillus chartarius]|uniref:Transposase n=1 Tax=Paenibacillus chartarius TaxID=747481 RepID=A0ABV6DJD3_9BACL